MAKDVRWCIVFLVAFLLCMQEIHARSMPKQRKDDNDSDEDSDSSSSEEQKGDCFYKGKWYSEGEDLPTDSLCLVCTCRKGFTEPSRFTCAVKDCPWGYYQVKYPNCTPVYSSTECCPVDWKCDSTDDEPEIKHGLSSIPSYCFRPVPLPFVPCKDRSQRYFYDMFSGDCKPFHYGACSLGVQNSFLTKEDCLETCKGVKVKREHKFELVMPTPRCKCDKRFFRHYEVKGCKPVYGRTDCEHCPSYYDCPETHEDSKVCIHDGVTYEPGQAIDLGPCHKCSCQWRGGEVGTVAEIVCPVNIECPEGFHKPLSKGCYHVYEQGKCCSVETRCVADETAESGTCEYDGKQYKYGQRIYPKEDPCAKCICSEKWDGPKGQTCEKMQCSEVEVHKADLLEGCIPIYHEATCCPIEYHCPNTTDGKKTVQGKEHDKCYFDGEAYPLRSVLPINHPTGCVTCTCRTPPDFTCIHRRCPSPPEEKEGVTCTPTFTPGSCCPTYKCQNDADVPEFCLEEPSPAFSHCPDESVRYYYDRYTGTCRSFKYGSCTVSKKNIFLTETECLNVCKKGNADQDNVVSNPVHDHPVQKCKCNPIHFQHYEAKGCKAVYGDSKCPKCPTHFECPTEIQKDKKVCTHKGKEYQIGEKVESGPCQRCICRESFDSQSAEISCAIVECPRERSGQRLGRGCRRIYEQGKCCAVSTVCENDNSTSTTDSEVTCDYNGKIYPFGDKIYLKDNPCRYCYCNKDWSGPDGPTCVEIDCVIEKKKKNLERGCIPVYLENSCCPITWHCPASASGEETKDLVQQEVKDMVQQGDKCYFGGKSYELGSILQVSESGSCITCTCSTPPDFTCIYRYCPPPPDSSTLEPGSTCRPVFRHDTCCPEYQCTSTKKAIDRPLTRLLLGKWHTCNCDSRYFQHYKVKNCKPVFDDPSCNCPTRFECPSLQHLSNNCNYKGVIYDFMDHINSSNPCKKCECMASDDGLEIGCTQIECPEDLGVRPEGECRYVYKADKCCAVNKVCGQEIDKAEFTCEYEGKKYVPGEKIHHKHDPCKVCYCTRDWDGMDGTRSQCYSSDCMLEKKMKVLKRGCVPVYHEKTCCPIEYYCPEDYQKYIVPVEKKDYICSLPVDPGSCRALFDKYYFDVQTGKCTKFYYGGCDGNENRFDSLEECEKACENHFRRPADSEKQCQFGIHFYPVGHVLEPPNKCVTCTCTTPPDFTCIHRSCPPPPSDDCQLSSRQQSCCPSYICPLPKSTCSLPPDSGICLAAFRRYFYNPREGKCQQFIYGGCLGNENNFWSPEDCEAACGHHRDSTGAEFLLSQEPALDRCKEIKCEAGEECKLQKVCTGRHCLLRPRCTKISSECEVPECTEGCVLSIGDDQCPTCECSLLRKVSSKNSSEPEFHLVGLSEVKDSCSGVKCSDGKECKLQKVCTGRHCLLRPRCVSATGCDTPVCTEPGCVLVVSDEPNSCPTCECTLLKKPSGNKLHEFLVSTGIKHTHHSGKKSSESSAPEFILSASSVHESGCKGLTCGDDEECTMQKVCTGRHCLLRPKCTKRNLDCPTPICAEGCALTLSDDGSGCLTCECSLLRKDSSSEFHELVSDDDVKNSCLGIKCSDGKECKLQKVCTGRHCLLRPRCVSATGCDVPECTELGCILVVHDESKSCPTCECTLLKKPSRSSSPAPVLSASSAYRASCKGMRCADDEECTLQKVCTDRHCLIRPRCAKHNLRCPIPGCSEGCAPSLGDDGCPSCECSLLKKVTGDSESVRYQAVSASDLLHSCSEMHCPEGKECRLQKVCTDRHCLLRPRCISSGSQCPEPDCTEGCVPVVTGDDGCPTCECKLLRKPSSQSSKN